MQTKKPFKRCVLHIGTEKTGTTAIQHYLRHHRERLLEQGVCFPLAANTEHLSQWEFAAIVHHGGPWKQDMGRELGITDSASQDQFRAELQKKLELEFAEIDHADTLVISSEHLQSRLYLQKELLDLKAFLDPFVEQIEVIVYFRRQDELALSLLSTRLKSSAQVPLGDVVHTLNQSPRYYAYDEIFQRWATAFGQEAMQARLYEPQKWLNGNLIDDFCSAARIPHFETEDSKLNPSLNKKGFQFINALNHLHPNTSGDRSDEERAELVRRVGQLFAGKYYPLSRDQAISFYRQFDTVNERLRTMAFPEHSTPLFFEDFSQYPEEAEPTEPDFNDAVEVAVALWNSRPIAKEPPPTSALRKWLPWLKR